MINNSEVIYRELVENTPLCVKVFDKDGKLLYVSKGGREEHFLLDKSEEEIRQWDWMGTIKSEYQQAVKEVFDRVFESCRQEKIEFEHVSEGSNNEWCLGVISPINDEATGKVKYVLFYSVDISDHKKALEEIERDAMKYKALIDAVPLCIKWFDSVGNLISVNRHGREEHHLIGKSEEEIRTWKYMGCIKPEYHQLVNSCFAKALEGSESEFDIEHVPGTSTGRWCHSSLITVKDSKGEMKYVLFISRDVTEEKEGYEQRSKSIEELTKFKELSVGRELKMIELKEEIIRLRDKLNKNE
jgi:PAS domain S-box-containing protein